ncbi:MAG TPA: hypothetical protein VFZ24_02300 [Longimicrobiales bacterium]
MIRREVLTQRDNRSVKWSLMAAAFALSLGFYAEHVLSVQVEEETATVAEEAAPVPAPAVIAG